MKLFQKSVNINPQNGSAELAANWFANHFLGLGRFHALLLLTTGLCLMTAIIETLSIGFVIPLIESECDLKLSLSDKGILNGAAFAGTSVDSLVYVLMLLISFG